MSIFSRSLFSIHRSIQVSRKRTGASRSLDAFRYGACWTGWHDMREFLRKPGKMAIGALTELLTRLVLPTETGLRTIRVLNCSRGRGHDSRIPVSLLLRNRPI
jgi:hypothetical protein